MTRSPSSSSSSSSSPLRFSPLSLLSLAAVALLSLSPASLTSAQSTGAELRSGISAPFRSVSAGSWTYFTFYNQIAAADVVLGLTALSGDPDIYYSGGNTTTCSNPTLTSYTDKNDQDGGGVLTATGVPSGAKFCIGIYADGGWEANGRVLVVASSEATAMQNPIQLQVGEPVNDVLRGGQYRYYQYTVPVNPPPSISLSITQRSDSPGDPDLYVNQPSAGEFPSTTSFWKEARESGNDIITLDAPTPGIYYIAVYAWGEQTSQYQMIVVSSGTRQELADGVQYPMSLEPGRLCSITQFTCAQRRRCEQSYADDCRRRRCSILGRPVHLLLSHQPQAPTRVARPVRRGRPPRRAPTWWSSAARRARCRAGLVLLWRVCGDVRAEISHLLHSSVPRLRWRTAGRCASTYLLAVVCTSRSTCNSTAAATTSPSVHTHRVSASHQIYISFLRTATSPTTSTCSSYMWFNVEQGNARGQTINVITRLCRLATSLQALPGQRAQRPLPLHHPGVGDPCRTPRSTWWRSRNWHAAGAEQRSGGVRLLVHGQHSTTTTRSASPTRAPTSLSC